MEAIERPEVDLPTEEMVENWNEANEYLNEGSEMSAIRELWNRLWDAYVPNESNANLVNLWSRMDEELNAALPDSMRSNGENDG